MFAHTLRVKISSELCNYGAWEEALYCIEINYINWRFVKPHAGESETTFATEGGIFAAVRLSESAQTQRD